MFTLSLEVEGVEDAADLLTETARRHTRPPAPLWQQLAEVWQRSFVDNLSRGGNPPFVPLSETTIKLRGRSGSPLVVTGKLKASLETLRMQDDQLEVGSKYRVARFHELGFVTGPASMIPGRKVPARPWIHLDQRTLESSYGLIDRFVLGD